MPNRDGVSDVPMLCSIASDAVAYALFRVGPRKPASLASRKHLTGLGEWLRARIKKCEELWDRVTARRFSRCSSFSWRR